MIKDNAERIAQVYSRLRAMSGGKLTSKQVEAGDSIISMNGIEVFENLIGMEVKQKTTGLDISEKGFSIIKEFEGFESEAYLDTGGVWTIGYGTIKYPNGVRVKKGDKCTKEQAESWLKNDSKWVDACLDKYVKVSINQNQFDALASLVYNIGETAFVKSTLLEKLNKGDFKGAADQFDRWVNDNGKRIQGLVNRRAKEKLLFLTKQ